MHESLEMLSLTKRQRTKARGLASGKRAGHVTGSSQQNHESGISSSNNFCTAQL